MSPPPALRRLAALTLCAAIATKSTSCGTLLHPERRGQPPGRIDPAIAILDGIGLLLFFIPGAVAFAVDFYTGAIYLPPQYSLKPATDHANADLVTIRVDPQDLTRERIEDIVRQHTGHSIRLEPGAYEAARLQRLGDFGHSVQTLAQRPTGTTANAVLFRCQSE